MGDLQVANDRRDEYLRCPYEEKTDFEHCNTRDYTKCNCWNTHGCPYVKDKGSRKGIRENITALANIFSGKNKEEKDGKSRGELKTITITTDKPIKYCTNPTETSVICTEDYGTCNVTWYQCPYNGNVKSTTQTKLNEEKKVQKKCDNETCKEDFETCAKKFPNCTYRTDKGVRCPNRPTEICPHAYRGVNGCTVVWDKCPYDTTKKKMCQHEGDKEKDCPEDYKKCNVSWDDCPYKEENKKKEKKTLIINKNDIKRTKKGKFEMTIYPIIKVKGEIEDKGDRIVVIDARDETRIERSADLDVSYYCGEHMIKRLRDLDDVETWEFEEDNGAEVHDSLVDEVYGNMDSYIEELTDDDKRTEMLKRRLNKSMDKAIAKKRFNFKKLEDIITGHQELKADEKDDLMDIIIQDAVEYVSTCFVEAGSKDPKDDLTEGEKRQKCHDVLERLKVEEGLSDEEIAVIREERAETEEDALAVKNWYAEKAEKRRKERQERKSKNNDDDMETSRPFFIDDE